MKKLCYVVANANMHRLSANSRLEKPPAFSDTEEGDETTRETYETQESSLWLTRFGVGNVKFVFAGDSLWVGACPAGDWETVVVTASFLAICAIFCRQCSTRTWMSSSLWLDQLCRLLVWCRSFPTIST